jgi:hypothetical protein
MLYVVVAVPQTKCGSSPDLDCVYCICERNCDAAQQAKTLRVASLKA